MLNCGAKFVSSKLFFDIEVYNPIVPADGELPQVRGIPLKEKILYEPDPEIQFKPSDLLQSLENLSLGGSAAQPVTSENSGSGYGLRNMLSGVGFGSK